MNRFLALILAGLSAAFAPTVHAAADPYAAIYDRVLQPNADRAAERCAQMQATLADGDAAARLAAFVELARGWAGVQASYVLGGYEADAMDYPLLLDSFHMGKEDVHESLARIIDGNGAPATVLYKNSYKTLNALDDVLFSGPWSARRAELAAVITGNVCKYLGRIRDGYRSHRAEFVGNRSKALTLLVNAEIETIYKTRDWRIAQVSGLTRQTVGKVQPQHQQYPHSQASWAAIGAVIDTNVQLLAADRQPNIATIAHDKKADAGLASVQEALAATVAAYRDTRPDHGFATSDVIPVYQGLLDLEKAFYQDLARRIGVTASLIDADGD